ncbi:FecR domain-containing protein [uncultured Nisaea sp.]|uniref:FecR family protein n=1 Tax=uncultured Nisaea sp. TaxID=538215 RepID=UPI0030EC1D8C
MNPEQETMQETPVDAARDWVIQLASGDVGEADMQAFKAWLAETPEHQAAFEQERQFWQQMESLRGAADAMARREFVPSRGYGRKTWRTALVGGLAAACLMLGVFFGEDVRISMLSDYSTVQGEQRTVALPDGSTVYLNTDTAIAVTYGDDERRVELLRGEALFQVASNPDRPFRVIAEGGMTEAVGTAFVIREDPADTVVTVTEGVVEVRSPLGAAGSEASVRAKRGQQTRYRTGAAPGKPVSVDVAAATLWRDGVIRMDDLPLDEAIAELDRYRPGRILLLGNAPYRAVGGAFDISDIDGAVAGLAATHDLTVTHISPFLVILR